ncbi:hypothetical protein [Paraflavitalea speifideaquila]|uniref:hypothetical protein n=1 Tax=Paraflavitalea speifideaquila TaxID=3076558 RepID=UPI0028E77DBB|nr:hypothetical protein [Paraflavitalea speifideiaquila]
MLSNAKRYLSSRLQRLVWCCLCLFHTCLLTAQVSPTVPATTQQHSKQVIGYITQWDAWKEVANLVPKGGYNQLNVDYSQYTILNFSFFLGWRKTARCTVAILGIRISTRWGQFRRRLPY